MFALLSLNTTSLAQLSTLSHVILLFHVAEVLVSEDNLKTLQIHI